MTSLYVVTIPIYYPNIEIQAQLTETSYLVIPSPCFLIPQVGYDWLIICYTVTHHQATYATRHIKNLSLKVDKNQTNTKDTNLFK
jgi:hypothetical protein